MWMELLIACAVIIFSFSFVESDGSNWHGAHVKQLTVSCKDLEDATPTIRGSSRVMT